MQTYPDRPTLGAMLLQHVIVFLICVVFPGLVTGLAPATWVSFDRSGATVAATTRTCLYFLVPYKIQHIEQVTSVSSRERADFHSTPALARTNGSVSSAPQARAVVAPA